MLELRKVVACFASLKCAEAAGFSIKGLTADHLPDGVLAICVDTDIGGESDQLDQMVSDQSRLLIALEPLTGLAAKNVGPFIPATTRGLSYPGVCHGKSALFSKALPANQDLPVRIFGLMSKNSLKSIVGGQFCCAGYPEGL